MILLAKVLVLFMVDSGVALQDTLLFINADNHSRGGSNRQEAERRSTVVACSQAAGEKVTRRWLVSVNIDHCILRIFCEVS